MTEPRSVYQRLVKPTSSTSRSLRMIAIAVLVVFSLLLFLAQSHDQVIDGYNQVIEQLMPSSIATVKEAKAAAQNIVYVQSGPMPEWAAIALLFTRYAHPRAQIHLLCVAAEDGRTDNPWVQWKSLFTRANINVVHVKEDTESHRQLAATYLHSSSNALDYELFCMMRYSTMFNYMVKHDLDSILVLDADVVPFTNILERYPYRDWSFGPDGVFMQIFSRDRMAAFAFFVNAFYDRPMEHICADIRRFGYVPQLKSWASRIKTLSTVKCEGQGYYQFSDMVLYGAFQKTYKLTPVVSNVSASPEHYAVGQPHDLDPTICGSPDKFLSHIEWVNDDLSARRLQTKITKDPLFAIHLQGECKRVICPVFCPKLAPEHMMLIECCRR